MFDRITDIIEPSDRELESETIKFLNETREKLKGSEGRKFMASIVRRLNPGGQSRAKRELGWDPKTMRKGEKELKTGFDCIDNFSGRGRKRTEERLANILQDIKDIVEPVCQADPTFRTGNLYSPLTAKEVRLRLIEQKNYTHDELPVERTINNLLNSLNFRPRKVVKSKPKKKIPQTDAIFENVHRINKIADETDGVVRLSADAKATINVGPLSRGGRSRQGEKAADHDFAPESVLKLFGIQTPFTSETNFFFTESNITSDFMVDCLEKLWPEIKIKYDPHTLVINLDNGPENSSSRTQFMKRMVEFAQKNEIDVDLVYYPPYHSKYNPIERVWGVLENHWNGELLSSVEKVLGLARTMTYNGVEPVVHLVKGIYETGVKLTKKAMIKYEDVIQRLPNLEKWSVDIPCFAG